MLAGSKRARGGWSLLLEERFWYLQTLDRTYKLRWTGGRAKDIFPRRVISYIGHFVFCCATTLAKPNTNTNTTWRNMVTKIQSKAKVTATALIYYDYIIKWPISHSTAQLHLAKLGGSSLLHPPIEQLPEESTSHRYGRN
jgi:hypothetical protein